MEKRKVKREVKLRFKVEGWQGKSDIGKVRKGRLGRVLEHKKGKDGKGRALKERFGRLIIKGKGKPKGWEGGLVQNSFIL